MKKIGFILVYLLVLLIVAEMGLRVVSHLVYRTPLLDVRRFRSDPYLIWKFNPGYQGTLFGYKYATINQYGCLGREVATPKPAGTIRVVAVGGSVTFGQGVADVASNFCSRLEAKLNATRPDRRWEVINAAVPSYSSWNGRQFVENYLAELNPDVLLVAFGWNDAIRDRVPDKDIGKREGRMWDYQPNLFFSGTLIGYFIGPKLQILNKVWERIAKRRSRSESSAGLDARVSVEDYQANLEAICKWCRQRGVKVVLWSEPEAPHQDKMFDMIADHQVYVQAMRQVAAADSVPMADVTRAFEQLDPHQMFDNPDRDWMHANAKGQDVMAETVFQAMAAGKLLEEPAPVQDLLTGGE